VGDIERLSFTIEQPLLTQLNTLMEKSGYANRSEFIRDLIRSRLVEEEWKAGEEALGTITILYDHEKRELGQKLTAVQHHHHENVLATTHIHLSEKLCAEMIMVRGRAEVIEHMADHMRQQKGVYHAVLAMSSTGVQLT
jgi:CopG family nickel-responsive transcriptional regulator